MKNNKGITLIALTIMIIVLMILSSIAVYSGSGTVKYTKFNKVKSQVEIMQTEVNSWYQQYNAGDTSVLDYGIDITVCDQEKLKKTLSDVNISSEDKENYKYFSADYLVNTLSIDGIDEAFLIDIKNRKVLLFDGITYEEETYYTPEDFGINNVENIPISEVKFELLNQNIAPNKILIYDLNFNDSSGQNVNVSKYIIEYKKQDDNNWKDITRSIQRTEYNSKQAYYFNISESGIYDIKISTMDRKVFLNKNISIERVMQVEDYVNYSPDTASNYSLSSTVSGYTTDQTIPQDTTLKWRVFKIYEDGSVDLISDRPTDVNAAEDTENLYRGVKLKEPKGYNNGVYILNDICSKQYSNTTFEVTARSLNIEDIEEKMSNKGISARNAHLSSINIPYGGTKTYTDESTYYPVLYAQENGSGVNTTELKTDGIDQSDAYYTEPTTDTYVQASSKSLTIKQTYYRLTNINTGYVNNSKIYDILFTSDSPYWIASRYTTCIDEYADFGFFFIESNTLAGYGMFGSNLRTGWNGYQIRPIIPLKTNIEYTYDQINDIWEMELK